MTFSVRAFFMGPDMADDLIVDFAGPAGDFFDFLHGGGIARGCFRTITGIDFVIDVMFDDSKHESLFIHTPSCDND